MEDAKCKEKMKRIMFGVGMTAVLFFPYILYLCCKNNVTKGITIASVIIYSLFLIPVAFYGILSDPKQSKKEIKYYHYLHLIYVFFPVALIGQIIIIKQILWMIVITQVTSTLNLIILYICCKHLIKKHFKCLRYSNKLITVIFSFLLTLLCWLPHIIKVEWALLFIQPLVGLQVLYEKVDLFVEEEKT